MNKSKNPIFNINIEDILRNRPLDIKTIKISDERTKTQVLIETEISDGIGIPTILRSDFFPKFSPFLEEDAQQRIESEIYALDTVQGIEEKNNKMYKNKVGYLYKPVYTTA